MSRQPAIQLPVADGHWTLTAHKRVGDGGIKYSATLQLKGCDAIACYVFASELPEIDGDCLVLDSAHIYLGDQDAIDRVDQFLLDTDGYVNGATA